MRKLSKRIVSAGIIPVRKVGGEYQFLLLRVGSFIEPPKGRQAEGETLLETALRETTEETSIPADHLHFNWGYDSFTTDTYKKGTKVNVFYVAETDVEDITLPINPEIGKAEHDQAMWANYNQAEQLLNGRLRKALLWAWDKIEGAG